MDPLITPVSAEQEDLTVTLGSDPQPAKERKLIEYGKKYAAILLRDPEKTMTKGGIDEATGEEKQVKPMLVFTFVLTDPDFKGRTFVDRVVTSTEWKVASMAEALGREIKDRKVSFAGTAGTLVELVFADNGRGYPTIKFVNKAKAVAAQPATPANAPLIA